MSEKICLQPSMNGEPFHVIQRREGLCSIAARYTGDGSRWREIVHVKGGLGATIRLPDSWNIGKLHSGTSEGEKVLGRLIRYTSYIDPCPVLLTKEGERVIVDLASLLLLEPQVKDLNELMPAPGPVVKSRKTCERCGHETPKQYCGDCLGDMSRALTGASK